MRLSLYVCDYGGANGSALGQLLLQAVAVTDLRSVTNSSAYQQVLLTQAMGDTEGGVYLTLEISGSVRLRFSGITGDNPSLSALFFDPAQPAQQ